MKNFNGLVLTWLVAGPQEPVDKFKLLLYSISIR